MRHGSCINRIITKNGIRECMGRFYARLVLLLRRWVGRRAVIIVLRFCSFFVEFGGSLLACHFFEMPVHPSSQDLPRMKLLQYHTRTKTKPLVYYDVVRQADGQHSALTSSQHHVATTWLLSSARQDTRLLRRIGHSAKRPGDGATRYQTNRQIRSTRCNSCISRNSFIRPRRQTGESNQLVYPAGLYSYRVRCSIECTQDIIHERLHKEG